MSEEILDIAETPQAQLQEPDEKTAEERARDPRTSPGAPTPMLIELDEHGVVRAKNHSELMRIMGAKIAGGLVPKQFDTVQKLFSAIQFVRELGLPDPSIRQVAMIHGSPSLWGDLPLALVQKTGKLKHFKEIWFDTDYNLISFENKNLHLPPFGAICWIQREGFEIEQFAFTMPEAEKAGLYPSNSNSPWTKYTKVMLRYRARSLALKSTFPDALNGVAIAEYDSNTLPDQADPPQQEGTVMKDVTPQADKLKDAQALFGKK